MTERQWMSQVLKMLRLAGWATYHTFDSRRSTAGFPDIIAIKERRMLAIELKADKGKATPEQIAWIRAFAQVAWVDAFVLRPAEDLSELQALIA